MDYYGHVGSTSGVSGLGDGIDQLAGNTKVTQLYVATPVH